MDSMKKEWKVKWESFTNEGGFPLTFHKGNLAVDYHFWKLISESLF